ncbi:MAG: YHS domain-containing protein [Methanomicrobiales archaeon]|nr:YHS domain-containing protein [Methanomicrobiales archaeon]
MPTDPVCYLEVEEEDAPYTAEYRGTTYYFCTDFCRKKFLENPAKYAKLASNIKVDPGASC